MIAFGPVPSRRLGRSLGINNIPPKTCSYSCVYCQLGTTTPLSVTPKRFYGVADIYYAASEKLEYARLARDEIDFITFAPTGEPTLDANLHKELQQLHALGKPLAVITNASLLGTENVRKSLYLADWVSLKVDAATAETWKKINRPHGRLRLQALHEGMITFARNFKGILTTETMLVKDVNDGRDELEQIASFINGIDPHTAYISIPYRPPAEKSVAVPESAKLIRAYIIFSGQLRHVELLIESEGVEFSRGDDAEREILSITAVHPMSEKAVYTLLKRSGRSWGLIEDLLQNGKLKMSRHNGITYYLKNLNREIV